MTETQTLLEEINEVVEYHLEREDQLSVSLFGGRMGLAIYYFYLSRFLGKKEMADKASQLIEGIVEELDSGIRRVPKTLHSYAGGLAGVAYALTHLKEQGFIEVDHQEAFAELDSFFLDMAAQDYSRQVSDFLYGPMGILYYYLGKPPDSRTELITENLFDMFLDKAVVDQQGLRIRNTVIEQEFDEFDLCMAHGLSGNLIVLGQLALSSSRAEKVKEAMLMALDYICSAEQRDFGRHNGNSFFPTSINEQYSRDHLINQKNYNSRLAWCYGDLGTAYALFRCGQVLKNTELSEKGLNVALETTKRRTTAESGVHDIFFCHGSSGVSYLYKKLYKKTGEKELLRTSQWWNQFTQSLYCSMNKEKLNRNYALNLLDGLPAVALVLIESEDPALFGWDQFFLLK